MLSGPENRHLWRVLPETVELAGVYLGADSIAYVDLHQRDNGPPPRRRFLAGNAHRIQSGEFDRLQRSRGRSLGALVEW